MVVVRHGGTRRTGGRAGAQRLLAGVTGAPAVLFAVDGEGTITLWEGGHLGGQEGAVGSSAFDLFGGASRMADNLRQVLSGEAFVSLVEAHGEAFECLFDPLRGRGDAIVGAVGLAVDVAVRRRAEEALRQSEERFRLTFERAAVGMAHVAPDGRWLMVNEKLLEIVGYSREELLSLSFQEITHPEDLRSDLRCVERLLAGEIRTYSLEKRYLRKDGRRVWVSLSTTLVRDSAGKPAYFVSMVDEITARKLRELVPDPLTPREREVLRLVSHGMTNPRIAQELRHSLGTVKLDVRRILAKLRVKNRAAAVDRAVELGLIPPP